jgi:beta-galactosidase
MLKAGLLAPVAAAAAQGMGPIGAAAIHAAAQTEPEPPLLQEAAASAIPGAGRERLLLDFGWRFHFGNANDPARDFGFGGARSGNFQKTGGFIAASSPAFDDSDWRDVDLPHDWAIELPFENDPALASKGFYPLGRTYPETSVGWYRRVLELPAADAGRRITIEFDGAYRETMVVFNGFYIGVHSGGYDPFHFDVTDFAYPGRKNVLLVRVDATLSDGWFYEGAGIYRHVWLVKTHPLHVKQWGTFVSSKVTNGDAAVSIRTEVKNHGKVDQSARVTSTILDPSGKPVAKSTAPPASVAAGEDQTWEQTIAVRHPSAFAPSSSTRRRVCF